MRRGSCGVSAVDNGYRPVKGLTNHYQLPQSFSILHPLPTLVKKPICDLSELKPTNDFSSARTTFINDQPKINETFRFLPILLVIIFFFNSR